MEKLKRTRLPRKSPTAPEKDTYVIPHTLKRQRRDIEPEKTVENVALGVGILCSQDGVTVNEEEIEEYILSVLEKPSHLKELHEKFATETKFQNVQLKDIGEVLDVSSLVTQHEVSIAHFKPNDIHELPSWICTTVYSSDSWLEESSDAFPRMSAESAYHSILAKIDDLI